MSLWSTRSTLFICSFFVFVILCLVHPSPLNCVTFVSLYGRIFCCLNSFRSNRLFPKDYMSIFWWVDKTIIFRMIQNEKVQRHLSILRIGFLSLCSLDAILSIPHLLFNSRSICSLVMITRLLKNRFMIVFAPTLVSPSSPQPKWQWGRQLSQYPENIYIEEQRWDVHERRMGWKMLQVITLYIGYRKKLIYSLLLKTHVNQW